MNSLKIGTAALEPVSAGFVLSLDAFVITFFTAGVGDNTFPVKIYSMLRFSVTPEVNAASTVLIIITLSLTLVAMIMQSRWAKK